MGRLRPGGIDHTGLRRHRAPLLRAPQTGFHRSAGLRQPPAGNRATPSSRSAWPNAYREICAQWPVAHTPEELAALRQGHARTFLVYTLPTEIEAYQPALWQAVEAGYEPVKIFWGSLGGGEVYVCREKAPWWRRVRGGNRFTERGLDLQVHPQRRS